MEEEDIVDTFDDLSDTNEADEVAIANINKAAANNKATSDKTKNIIQVEQQFVLKISKKKTNATGDENATKRSKLQIDWTPVQSYIYIRM